MCNITCFHGHAMSFKSVAQPIIQFVIIQALSNCILTVKHTQNRHFRFMTEVLVSGQI